MTLSDFLTHQDFFYYYFYQYTYKKNDEKKYYYRIGHISKFKAEYHITLSNSDPFKNKLPFSKTDLFRIKHEQNDGLFASSEMTANGRLREKKRKRLLKFLAFTSILQCHLWSFFATAALRLVPMEWDFFPLL